MAEVVINIFKLLCRLLRLQLRTLRVCQRPRRLGAGLGGGGVYEMWADNTHRPILRTQGPMSAISPSYRWIEWQKLSLTYLNYISGCYDCNFAPSGFVKGPGDWAQGSEEVGYLRCGLITRTDRYFVHKDRCLSGRCYIRQEENGSE